MYATIKAEEKQLLDAFFETVEIIDVDTQIANIVIEYKAKTQKKIKLPDAIILATAKYLNATLITDDWDDFSNIDETVSVLPIEDYKIK